jgi:hypothetical protein
MAGIARGAVIEFAAEIDNLHEQLPLSPDFRIVVADVNAGAFPALPQDGGASGER